MAFFIASDAYSMGMFLNFERFFLEMFLLEKRLDEQPYSSIRKGNYHGLKRVYKSMLKEKEEFLKTMEK